MEVCQRWHHRLNADEQREFPFKVTRVVPSSDEKALRIYEGPHLCWRQRIQEKASEQATDCGVKGAVPGSFHCHYHSLCAV